MTHRTWLVFILALMALVQAAATRAADTPPCTADIEKLCADVPPGQGRVQACLKEHESEISSICQKTVDELSRELRTAAAVCRWDIGRLCSGIAPGAGKVLACLSDRTSDLSPECKAGMDKLK